MLCGLLQCRRDGFVGLVDRRGQLPGARLRVLEQLGEPGVDLGTTKRISGLVDPRGEERMREPDSLALELDDTRFECRRQADTAYDS
jgi:hypothetical protein